MGFFKSRSFLVLIGLILLSLMIWFAGPYFAFADHKPLESVVVRLVIIGLLFVIWLTVVLTKQFLAGRANQKLANEVTQDSGKGGGATGGADAAQLKKRFEEAIEALKKTRKKGSRNLYELPWYIIIGPPGSGKTTVLANSGLNFPLAQKFGKEALRGVGGTRNCDWWFTDQAILLDTAGRYTTQDSNQSADAGGWTSFLQLLKKYRGRQPINGVLVAISAADLLTLNEQDRERHVISIRERLEELNRELRIAVPVYFMITKCDLIAGFTEFFDEFGQEARSQVWGVTFPIEASEEGTALESLDKEFDVLLERLQTRVISRMEQERDLRKRAPILAFPQQVALLKPLLGDLLKRVFNASNFDSAVLLRGVYLTSGTQEGTPIDRMLGAIARSFGFTNAAAANAGARGKAFFIERLLQQVVFQESGLAGVNRKLQLQKIFIQYAAYIACVALLVLGVLAFTISYNRNASYIDGVSEAAKALPATELPAGAATSADLLLPRLEALRTVTSKAEAYKDGAPWSMRFGLYRGKALGEAARDAYLRELNATLVPVLAQQFERNLTTSASEPDRLYEYLKGYLMLGDAEHRDLDHLRYLNQAALVQAYPSDPSLRDALNVHLNELLADRDLIKASVVNKDVVDQARYSLRTASLPVLMYSRLKIDYLDPNDKRAIALEIELGSGAGTALIRKSGEKLGTVVPALYTRPVFNQVNKIGKLELIKQFADDRWVFGESLIDMRQASTLAFQVMQVYEDDFIKYWKAQVGDVKIKPTANSTELAEVVGIIASPSSPYKRFLNIVADNTNLLKQDDALKDPTAKLTDAISAKAESLNKILGVSADAGEKPGSKATREFEPIRKLVEGPPGAQPIDGVLGQLRALQTKLKSTGGGVGESAPTDPAALADLKNLREGLQTEAKMLPPEVGELVAKVAEQGGGFVAGAAKGSLAQLYAEQVQRQCRELIDGRYPFVKSSTTDVPLGDFAQVFGTGGLYDAFYAQQLKPLVDTSKTPWRWREGAPAISDSVLKQFQLVQRIRETYFKPGGQAVEARFNLSPGSLDVSVARLAIDVDGQPFEYRHGPQQSRTIAWPGASGAGKASVVLEDRGGSGPAVRFDGPWAWFRVLDRANVQQQSDTRFDVTFNLEGKSAEVLLDATSIRNPFASRDLLAQFRCGN